jgi:hypothetical protein
MSEQPEAKRRGWLRNGNPPGDYSKAPRCGAKTRRGTACQGPAMPNGRCRMHGGPSTGPRTPEGRERSRQASLKHGYYSARAKMLRSRSRLVLASLRDLIDRLGAGIR